MSEFKIQMPKLGESVQEATITKWFVKEGDRIEEDDPLFEVSTDKVDSEIPSPVDGIIKKILFDIDSLVPVGEPVVIIEITDGQTIALDENTIDVNSDSGKVNVNANISVLESGSKSNFPRDSEMKTDRFYSPLVLSIAKAEKVSFNELETINGSGLNGRVQKNDLLSYIEARANVNVTAEKPVNESPKKELQSPPVSSISLGVEDQIIEMDRVRKIIAEHMVMSKQVSPHVTTVVEADVTNIVLWRNKSKDKFFSKYGEKITYMPIFTEAVAIAINEFPLLNSSVDGTRILIHKDINIAIAVAKPDGNLVVPVIKNAEQKNLVGLTKRLNQLAESARNNKLTVDDYQGGTFTITNFGSFRNLIGTPIINQPQVAILATGSIEKKPAVMETPTGDAIVVRHKMYLSLSYDHRIIDGAVGGAFLRRIADILENFNVDREV